MMKEMEMQEMTEEVKVETEDEKVEKGTEAGNAEEAVVVRTPEEQAAIDYLAALQAVPVDQMPARPLAAIVKVTSIEDVPKAGEHFAMVDISAGRTKWRVCLPRYVLKAGDRALFISTQAVLPFDVRYMFYAEQGLCPIKYRTDETDALYLLPIVQRNLYRANQGLLLPLEKFPEFEKTRVGTDVSEKLGIRDVSEWSDPAIPSVTRLRTRRYSPEELDARYAAVDKMSEEWRLSSEVEGPAPEFTCVTKLDDISAYPGLFSMYKEKRFELTEKLPGVNVSIYRESTEDPKHPIGICVEGQKIRDKPGDFYWQLMRRQGIDRALMACGKDVVLEGVVTGPSIKYGRRSGISELKFQLFDVYDLTQELPLTIAERHTFCKATGIAHVPVVLGVRPVFGRAIRSFAALVTLASGLNEYRKERLGIVVRADGADEDIWFEVPNRRYNAHGTSATYLMPPEPMSAPES